MATQRGGPRGASQAGFSLIELMVSLGLMLVVLGGAFRAFDDARKASEAGAMLADGSQNLRMGVMLMTRDLIQTGRELPKGGLPIPRGSGTVDISRPGPTTANLTFTSTWTTLPSICPGSALGPTVNGVPTDLVTTLYADPTLPLSEHPLVSIASNGATATVDSRTDINDEHTGIRAGDLIWFTNAVGNALQTVTRVQGQVLYFDSPSTADPYPFNQRTATSGSIIQIRTGTTFPTTSATRVTMVTYYLDSTVAGQVRLMRREGFGVPRLIASGIENLQLTYDVVDGTVNPTNQTDAVAPYSPSQIRKVNLFLSRRSDETFSQTRKAMRSAVATSVSLRSMSFMDRYR